MSFLIKDAVLGTTIKECDDIFEATKLLTELGLEVFGVSEDCYEVLENSPCVGEQ